jgi:predicted nucleic acid-binding protein
MSSSKKVLILLDADVVIHFFKADKISLLNVLFSGRLAMLDIVKDELLNNRTVQNVVENLFTFNIVHEMPFPTTSKEIMLEFKRISASPKMGKGESACMAVCKHQQHIIASSNTKDIKPYCEEHQIAYLTTLDILSIAVFKNKLTDVEGQICIDMILANGSKLKSNNLQDFISKEFDRSKMNY